MTRLKTPLFWPSTYRYLNTWKLGLLLEEAKLAHIHMGWWSNMVTLELINLVFDFMWLRY